MKPYGNNRYDNRQCDWGCCHGNALLCARGKRGRLFRKERRTNGDARMLRSRRRRTRSEGRRECAEGAAGTDSSE